MRRHPADSSLAGEKCARASLHGRRSRIPDVRDGLTRVERVVLAVLAETQAEMKGRNVPMAMLYGRVVERIDLSQGELMKIVQRLAGKRRLSWS